MISSVLAHSFSPEHLTISSHLDSACILGFFSSDDVSIVLRSL